MCDKDKINHAYLFYLSISMICSNEMTRLPKLDDQANKLDDPKYQWDDQHKKVDPKTIWVDQYI